MDSHTLTAAEIREICRLSDFRTRLLLDDPSLQFIKRHGPNGGAGKRFFTLRSVLRAIGDRPYFTREMKMALCARDIRNRNMKHD